jgi:hypothetical protein
VYRTIHNRAATALAPHTPPRTLNPIQKHHRPIRLRPNRRIRRPPSITRAVLAPQLRIPTHEELDAHNEDLAIIWMLGSYNSPVQPKSKKAEQAKRQR